MKNRYKILILMALILIGISSGIYFDEFSDVIFSAIFSGLFQTEPGTIFNNYECLFLISRIIQHLQEYFSGINMYGLVIVFINSCCIYYLILLLSEKLLLKKRNLLNYSIFTALVLLLLHDFIFIQFTKTAVYCNSLGCYLLLVSKRRWKQSLFFLTCGILLRTETFWLALVFFISINSIIHYEFLFQQLKKRKYIWLTVLSGAILISYLNKQSYNDDDKRYEVFRTYKYTIFDFKQKDNSRTIFSEKDQIKYAALRHAFFGDTDSLINTSTFKQLNITAHNRVDFISFFKTLRYKHNINRAFNNLADLAYNNRGYYIILVTVVIIIITVLFVYSEFSKLKKILLLLILCFIYLFLITVYIKMEDRVLNPVLLIITFYILHYLPDVPGINKKIITVFILLLSITELYCLSECYYKYRYRASLRAQSNVFFNSWKVENSNKILVPDLYSWQLLFPAATGSTSSLKKLNLFSLDNGYMSMMENHLKFNKKILNSAHFIDGVLFLQKNKQRVYILGSEERIKMTEEYINKIYHMNINFSKEDSLPVADIHAASGHLQLYLFKIKERL